MRWEHLRATAVLLLLLGLIAVLGTRAVRLARAPEVLGSLDERKWFGFAWRGPGLADRFGAVSSGLPEGEEVWLTLPPDADPLWWGLMARYHLPEQRVAGVLRRGEKQRPPRGTWIVAIGREGEAVVRRTRRTR